jgi:hypothetical protein
MSEYKAGCPKEYNEKIYNLQYITLPNGDKLHVTKLEDRSVSMKQKEDWKMNSYAGEVLIKKLDDEALFDTIEHYLMNAKRCDYPAPTYDEALSHVIVPELVKRLKDELNKQKIKNYIDFENGSHVEWVEVGDSIRGQSFYIGVDLGKDYEK